MHCLATFSLKVFSLEMLLEQFDLYIVISHNQ